MRCDQQQVVVALQGVLEISNPATLLRAAEAAAHGVDKSVATRTAAIAVAQEVGYSLMANPAYDSSMRQLLIGVVITFMISLRYLAQGPPVGNTYNFVL